MTVCVGVKVQTGLIFATDTATSAAEIKNGELSVSNIYDEAKKIFFLRKSCPSVIMISGASMLPGGHINNIIHKFISRIIRDKTDLELSSISVQNLCKLLESHIKHEGRFEDDSNISTMNFECFVGGFDEDLDTPEVWRFGWENGIYTEAKCIINSFTSAIFWSGQSEALNRLVLGVGSGLQKALMNHGFNVDDLNTIINSAKSHSEIALYHPGMPLGDAISLAKYMVDTTIGFTRFSAGPNVVGGKSVVAACTKYGGVSFPVISRKLSRSYNASTSCKWGGLKDSVVICTGSQISTQMELHRDLIALWSSVSGHA